ncbi:MAG: hypothetical protein DRG59_06920 [Deltaproteobacteria bacterium]|nr:MAG: hypothetical protein DRG59_06920 [Deltaproteobacteria bacterium]
MDLRSFAKVLAERQGGVQLRPGRSISKELPAEVVKNIFGDVPSAIAAYGVIITLRPLDNGNYKITVRMEEG